MRGEAGLRGRRGGRRWARSTALAARRRGGLRHRRATGRGRGEDAGAGHAALRRQLRPVRADHVRRRRAEDRRAVQRTEGTPITVEPITPTGNRNEAALSMITAGDPPDLFHALPRDYHPFANLGALLDLGPYIRKDKRAQDVIPMILEYWARGEARYAMPNNWSPQAIYFNKDLFTRQGLKTPDQYEKEGKWTFDTYLDLARQPHHRPGGDEDLRRPLDHRRAGHPARLHLAHGRRPVRQGAPEHASWRPPPRSRRSSSRPT